MMDGSISNTEGKIYIRYYQPVPKMVQVSGRTYVCDVRRGVSMLVVEESEVPALLAHEGGCCGGRRKVFSLASQGAVNLWEYGTR